MPPIRAVVTYKKKDGSLTISDDCKYLFWTPNTPPGASPAVTVPVTDITNLQQTPATAPKAALKVFAGENNYVFSFTHRENARKEQEAITDGLRNTIAANKAAVGASLVSTPAAGTPAQDGGDGQSAAMAIAKAVSSKAADEGWYDDAKLKTDIPLQKSLLEANPDLRSRFNQSLREKPSSVSVSQFTAQFWSTRLHLLRAHAIDKAQKQGEYNVLPEIRFTRIAGKEGEADIKHLQITKEQIKLIFKQYPIVSEAYNENCPPLDVGQFWQRFFSSRLLKKLKGEKVTQVDPPDSILDKYFDRRDHGYTAPMGQVPHFIDLEGNEQNHSQRKGNRPDETMRPSSFDKVPILRVLNNLSEKMLSHVQLEDSEAHAPIGQLEDENYQQLRLRDLEMQDADNRVVLNIKKQRHLMGGGEDGNELSCDAKQYLWKAPEEVLASLQTALQPENLSVDENGTLRLERLLDFDADNTSSSSDEEEEEGEVEDAGIDPTTNGHTASVTPRLPRLIHSTKPLASATSELLASIRLKRADTSTDPQDLQGLSQKSFNSLQTTINTTTEFLHYFYTLFHSSDSARVNELAQMVSTLDRSLDRINAVASAAEAERQAEIDKLEAQMRQYEKRTGKRRKVDLRGLRGGRGIVEAMCRPTVEAVGRAGRVYRAALETAEGG